jgi:hypothetical protein
VVFLGVVVFVCACSDIELITSIAAMVARSCFVIDPRKILERHKDSTKAVRAVKAIPIFSLCSFSYRHK